MREQTINARKRGLLRTVLRKSSGERYRKLQVRKTDARPANFAQAILVGQCNLPTGGGTVYGAPNKMRQFAAE
jgi:hypothetical protein